VISVCTKSYWDDIATSFSVLGPPLKPSSEDVQLVEKAVTNWSSSHPGEPLRALLLGVTPEIAKMCWPEASTLMAVDNSLAMAQAVWPGNIPDQRWVVCGDWFALPRPNSSCDVVIGDGSLNCVRYPDGLRALAKNIRDVLRQDGVLLLRCFVQPAMKELPEEVFSDLLQARIPSVNHFKFRLLMAMQSSTQQGISVHDVYEKWVDSGIDKEWLMARTGWEKRAFQSIEMYRGQDVVHTFPTVSELRAVLLEFFDETSVSIPAYPLGERCPRFVLRKRR
jgi:SAM-dependent methyltransferase